MMNDMLFYCFLAAVHNTITIHYIEDRVTIGLLNVVP
jgi:hypothetical protein